MSSLEAQAAKNLHDSIFLAIRHDPTKQRSLVVYDRDCELSRVLEQGYRSALPEGRFLDFAEVGPTGTREAIEALTPGDFVAFVQTQHFRLDDFRLRIELFKRGLSTIEHTHLVRMKGEQADVYVESLAYDPETLRALGKGLKARLDSATGGTVLCQGTRMEYTGGFEPAKLNVGDYEGMENIGGSWPIGEVFTEPKVLESVSGEARVFGFCGLDHLVHVVEPFTLVVKEGVVVDAPGAPEDFLKILEMIRAYETPYLREFGIGLNPAMRKGRIVDDVMAFERMQGLHFSLGEKHTVYKKQGITAKKSRYHIDIFIDVERIELDGSPIYDRGQFSP